MHAHSATISGHVRTIRTPETFWSVDLDMYSYIYI